MVYIILVLAAVVVAPIEVTDVGAVVVVEVKMAVASKYSIERKYCWLIIIYSASAGSWK